MPREYVPLQDVPLDEEERLLVREMEAGEWKSDPNFLRTDAHAEALSALEATADELARVPADPYRWKWTIVTLHAAVQSMMALALEGSNGLEVLRPQDTKRLLDADENGRAVPGDLQVDSFLNLYKKIKRDTVLHDGGSRKFVPQGTQDQSVKNINRLRNRFVHLRPANFSLVLNGLPEMALDCLEIIRFLAYESKNINWPETLAKRLERATGTAFAAARKTKRHLCSMPLGLTPLARPPAGSAS